uniref:Putative secreted peptide n=1 Tax=Anopheles braziliensis TaxID=58242 RepID=A0A2M3ZE72_9DIPT
MHLISAFVACVICVAIVALAVPVPDWTVVISYPNGTVVQYNGTGDYNSIVNNTDGLPFNFSHPFLAELFRQFIPNITIPNITIPNITIPNLWPFDQSNNPFGGIFG